MRGLRDRPSVPLVHTTRFHNAITENYYMNATSNEASASPLGNPWVQLIIGIICMACVANLQYGWTLFVNPIDAKYHWGREAIQVAFTVFVIIETWLVPVEGYLVDRLGPRWVVMGGGILVAIAWLMNRGGTDMMIIIGPSSVCASRVVSQNAPMVT